METSNVNNTLNERDPEELFRLKWNDFTVRAIVFLFHPIQRLNAKLKQKEKRIKENVITHPLSFVIIVKTQLYFFLFCLS